MTLKNTPDSYGHVSKGFHWGMALIIVALLAVGLTMGDYALSLKLKAYNLHKSFGILVLFLVLLRIFWHVFSKKPGFVPGLKPWEKWAATGAHLFLYAAMIGMPIAGWLMSSAAGRPVEVFGLFTLPDLIGKSDQNRDLFATIHEYLGYALIAAICVHAGAALKHHFISKDATLRRMLPLAAFALILLTAPSALAEKKWQLVPDQSKLSFSATQMGSSFTGTFKTFAADIAFDPDHLAQSKVTAEIDLGSVDSNDAERDGNMKGAEFFNVAQFPKARFESSAFEKTENGYVAKGTLTIGAISAPAAIDFTLDFTTDESGKEKAAMKGKALLDRSIWKIGTGDWADPSVIANDVSVDIEITALHP